MSALAFALVVALPGLLGFGFAAWLDRAPARERARLRAVEERRLDNVAAYAEGLRARGFEAQADGIERVVAHAREELDSWWST